MKNDPGFGDLPAPDRLFGPSRPRRPNVMAHHHVVVAGHYWASQAGMQILEAGGNAIDAGVATGLAIDVLESHYVGFGGVAPCMIHLGATGETIGISGVGVWPQAASAAYFRDRHGGQIPDGILQTVVPAAPAIWIAALARYGTMSFGDVAAAAIRFARDGFPMYPFYLDRLRTMAPKLREWPSSAAIYLPGGNLPAIGDTFVQADLARSLQYLADQERAHAGGDRLAGLRAAHDAFYRGDIARTIVAHHEQNGGLLTADDLSAFRARFETPCVTRFGDFDVHGCGAWSQGPMVLEALNILEGIDLRRMGHNTAAYIHAITEALKLAAADREVFFGDPDFCDVPLDVILSKDYAARRRALLDPARAWPGMPPAGEPGGVSVPPWRPDPSAAPVSAPAIVRPETSFLCVADRAGNVFAATPSDPATSGPIVPGTGIMPSMWGSRGYTAETHPARVGPGRRPRMSANPAIAVRPDRTVMAFGSPGSEVLGQAMLQAFLNMTVFGMDPQSAVETPRFASYSWPASAVPHAYQPGRLALEADIGGETGEKLTALGHGVTWWEERYYEAGSVCAILCDLERGVKWAGADPRRTAYAVGW
jgi:gamma-glutamyltranspeptidase/glutathione hydrolase